MTDILERAVQTARTLSPEMQDEVGRMLLAYLGDESEPVYELTPDERDSLAASLAQAHRGEFATDAEVRDLWAKRGL